MICRTSAKSGDHDKPPPFQLQVIKASGSSPSVPHFIFHGDEEPSLTFSCGLICPLKRNKAYCSYRANGHMWVIAERTWHPFPSRAAAFPEPARSGLVSGPFQFGSQPFTPPRKALLAALGLVRTLASLRRQESRCLGSHIFEIYILCRIEDRV